MYDTTKQKYLPPQIEIVTVKVECTHLSSGGEEMNTIDPVLENEFEEIL